MVLKIIHREAWNAALNSQHKWPHNGFPQDIRRTFIPHESLFESVLRAPADGLRYFIRFISWKDTSSWTWECLQRTCIVIIFLSSWSIMDVIFRAYYTILSRACFIVIPLLMYLYSKDLPFHCVTKRIAGGSDWECVGEKEPILDDSLQ